VKAKRLSKTVGEFPGCGGVAVAVGVSVAVAVGGPFAV
jgi:hypothetical protein